MPGGPKDVTAATFTTSSGTNVKNTSMLKGEAKRSSVENEKNSTTEYVTPSKVSGPFGGKAK